MTLLYLITSFVFQTTSLTEQGVFSHITVEELISVFAGIIFVWQLKYSKEKDKFDDKDESFSFRNWWKQWFVKRNDNIAIHISFSLIALWLGVDNLQAWLGDNLTVPEGVDEMGAAFMIGFTGTYVVEFLKKGV